MYTEEQVVWLPVEPKDLNDGDDVIQESNGKLRRKTIRKVQKQGLPDWLYPPAILPDDQSDEPNLRDGT